MSDSLPTDQFQGGGSKDNNDLNQWLWKEGEPLDKDDITNTYVAGYSAPETVGGEGDLIIYYGLDRLANNGTAQVGFWFFQDDSVGKGTTAGGGGFNFTGAHEVGDVLVQSSFTSGGRVSNVSVFEWVGSGGSEEHWISSSLARTVWTPTRTRLATSRCSVTTRPVRRRTSQRTRPGRTRRSQDQAARSR